MYENRYSYSPKTVLITGATGDFGRAFSERFAKLGSSLILFGRNSQKLDELKSTLIKSYPDLRIHTAAFLIQDKAAMISAIEKLPDSFKNVELLINNAGLALGIDPAYKCPIEDWEEMIEVNNLALIRMTRLVLDGMVNRKKGHIINIGSTAGNYPYPGGNVYCATKAFVKQFSLALRGDLQGTNIRVTNIEPGMVETQFSTVRFKGDEQKAAGVYANTLNINADDIAEAVVWSATLRPEMNINRIEIMPTVQSFATNPVERFVDP